MSIDPTTAQGDAPPLPADVAALIRDVVDRTHLRRREKLAVEEELIAHFRDGHAAGASYAELREGFGDVATAARLIRRAKKRCRSPLYHATRFVGFTLAGLVLAYALAWGYFMLGKPRPSVDYVAQLNAKAAVVPKDEAAWPVLRQAWLDAGLDQRQRIGELMFLADRKLTPLSPALPGDPHWPNVTGFFDDNAKLMDTLRSLPNYEGLGFVAAAESEIATEDLRFADMATDQTATPEPGTYRALIEESVLNVLLPQLGVLRFNARLLSMDLLYAAKSGDGSRMLQDFEAILALADFSREQSLLLNDLVAHSIANTAMENLAFALARYPDVLSNAQLRDAAHRLARIDDYATTDLSGERAVIEDIMQRVYSPSGNITAAGLRLRDVGPCRGVSAAPALGTASPLRRDGRLHGDVF